MKYISAGYLLAIKGMCFYYSPYFDQNIWRRASSLTGERQILLHILMAFRDRKITRTRRSILLQKITAGQSAAEYFSSTDSNPLLQASSNVSESPCSEPEPPEQPNPRTKTTSGLIYLGRLPECKKLKIWVRPQSILQSQAQ
jgi:hypothetical protein